MIWLSALFFWCICGAIAGLIGRPKGREVHGAVLGFGLGPIGVLIALFLAPDPSKITAPTSRVGLKYNCPRCRRPLPNCPRGRGTCAHCGNRCVGE